MWHIFERLKKRYFTVFECNFHWLHVILCTDDHEKHIFGFYQKFLFISKNDICNICSSSSCCCCVVVDVWCIINSFIFLFDHIQSFHHFDLCERVVFGCTHKTHHHHHHHHLILLNNPIIKMSFVRIYLCKIFRIKLVKENSIFCTFFKMLLLLLLMFQKQKRF
jgi:hypothetical protein